MDILKHVLSIEKFTRFVVMTGLLAGGCAYVFLKPEELKAFIAGYILFAANVWVLSYLAGLIFNVVSGSDKSTQKGTKNFAMVLGAAKTLFLFVALYVLIGLVKLSGIDSQKLVSTIVTGAGAEGLEQDESSLWVTNRQDGTLVQVDKERLTVLKTIKIPGFPIRARWATNGELMVSLTH